MLPFTLPSSMPSTLALTKLPSAFTPSTLNTPCLSAYSSSVISMFPPSNMVVMARWPLNCSPPSTPATPSASVVLVRGMSTLITALLPLSRPSIFMPSLVKLRDKLLPSDGR